MIYLLVLPGISELLIGTAFALVIYFFINRWIFRVDTITDHVKFQSHLLIEIAKHNNVSSEEIERLIQTNKEKFPAAVNELLPERKS